jgi:hypothetical protein
MSMSGRPDVVEVAVRTQAKARCEIDPSVQT